MSEDNENEGGGVVITIRRDPVWVDFSELLSGVSIKLRRLTSMEYAVARARAEKSVKAIMEQHEVLRSYGLDRIDSEGERIALTDAEMMIRIGSMIASVELSLLAIAAWKGVASDDGTAAPISRKVLTVLLSDERVEARILHEITAAARILVLEKKDSPASPNGTATGAVTGSAQNTAPDAPNSTSLVPGESAASEGDSALKPS